MVGGGGVVGLAEEACAELGLPALVLAGGEPGRAPWVVAIGYANLGGANLGGANPGGADLDRAEPLEVGHRFSVPGVTALVTATAVLCLVAEGRLGLDAPANDHLRAVRLADDSVTVRELLSHTGGVDNPAPVFGDSIPDLATLMGPVISCGGPRGTVQPTRRGRARRRRTAAHPRPRRPDPRGADQPDDHHRVHRHPAAACLDQSTDTSIRG